MRAALVFRLLLVPAALLGAACEDTTAPSEPPALAEDTPIEAPAAELPPATAGFLDVPHWAAGYLHAGAPTLASYAPVPYLSYNRSGGRMNVTKIPATTGRYIVTFTGLSAVVGTRNTVHVTEYGLADTYCKPVNGRLASDKLEVRCFRTGTRTPANAAFTVAVVTTGANAAFVYAHQPTSTGYAPVANGSFNPTGDIRVYRDGVGDYRVVFALLGELFSAFDQGHVQVNAVGTSKVHCIAKDWLAQAYGDKPFTLKVTCHTPGGARADSKFNALVQMRMVHMAKAYAHLPTTAAYSPVPSLSYNPAGGPITITRTGLGDYTVLWQGLDPEIIEGGTVLVTSVDERLQCKATSLFDSGATVHCFGPSGAPADARFSVLVGS